MGSRLVRWKLAGGLRQVEPRPATIFRATSSIGRSAAIWSRSQRWKIQAPLAPMVFSSLRKQIGPFQGPKIGEFGPGHQAIDQLGPLVRIGIGQERPRFVGQREAARSRRDKLCAKRPNRQPAAPG